MKSAFPFRLGSTSYVYPDHILPNVRRLAPVVDDVELVLFEVDDFSNLPDPDTVAALRDLAGAHDLTYTVHLPLDLRLAGRERAGASSTSIDKALKVIECTRPLQPYAYIAHLDGKAELAQGRLADWVGWRHDCAAALGRLGAACGDDGILCVENLEGYPIEEVFTVLDLIPVGLCLDVGHLWLDRIDAPACFRRFRDWVRVIHLHGIGARDHQSLRHAPAASVAALMDELVASAYAGVLTLEVFNLEDFSVSREMLLPWAGEVGSGDGH